MPFLAIKKRGMIRMDDKNNCLLSGEFQNCYGIKRLVLPDVQFLRKSGKKQEPCNKVLIYAPNGVMKSSFSRVFEDIAKGRKTEDRIFCAANATYRIRYRGTEYSFDAKSSEENPPASKEIYVINSFEDKFEFTGETVGTLLADEETRNKYQEVIREFSTDQRQLVGNLSKLTGLPKTRIKDALMADFGLPAEADWPDILEAVKKAMSQYAEQAFMDDVKYTVLFNEKTMGLYQNEAFLKIIDDYVKSLSDLLSSSDVLSRNFTDRNANALTKALAGNDLFGAKHKIQLRNGDVVDNIEQWKKLVSEELKSVYETPVLAAQFQKMQSLMTGNAEVSRLRDAIVEHREITGAIQDIPALKRQMWLYCFQHLDRPFAEYYSKFSGYTQKIRELYQRAAEQSDRWEAAVKEFNRRFRVPFEVQITNKANFLLKDEAPNLTFVYARGEGPTAEAANVGKEDLMRVLSMGEKRALYLLYILFDLEKYRQQAENGVNTLILADDVADSFDYKNKYAIIEYLSDLARTKNVDLVMLTHNYDFYRTLWTRLNVHPLNAFMAQKDSDGNIEMTQFPYRGDYFKNVVVKKLKKDSVATDEMYRILIASIPFYRNIFDYVKDDNSDYKKLTCFLHLKTDPLDTEAATLSELWEILRQFQNNRPFNGNDLRYCETLYRLADDIVKESTEKVTLENKLVLSIAIRLKAETFLRKKLMDGGIFREAGTEQTRQWFNWAMESKLLTADEAGAIEEVLLITPENIHLNSFMFEPLIDISNWVLKELYASVSALL